MSIERNEERPDALSGRANERQVGGDHYKVGGEEHWDRVARLGLDYFQGQITKYVERWKLKGGVQDLKKARHFLDKYIEIQDSPAVVAAPPTMPPPWTPPMPQDADPVADAGIPGRFRDMNGEYKEVSVHELATLDSPNGTFRLALVSWENYERVWVDAKLIDVKL